MLRSVSYVNPPQQFQPLDIARVATAPSMYAVKEPTFEKPALTVVQPPVAPSTTLSSEELKERWQDFINGVTKAKIAIGTVLTESQFLDSAHGTVRIGCPDDYHVSMLKRNKEFLSETLHSVLGVRMNVEPVLQGPSAASTQHPAQTVPNHGSNGLNGSSRPATPDEHPLLTVLRRELGAEPVRQ